MQSWKDFCSNTDSSNPWNGVYRYAAGKIRSKLILTTLKTGNNSYTTDMQSTINQMLEHFVPEDSEDGDEAYHKRARQSGGSPCARPMTKNLQDTKYRQHWINSTPLEHQKKMPRPARYSCTSSGVSPPCSRRSTSV
jgi:hypothetical protein